MSDPTTDPLRGPSAAIPRADGGAAVAVVSRLPSVRLCMDMLTRAPGGSAGFLRICDDRQRGRARAWPATRGHRPAVQLQR